MSDTLRRLDFSVAVRDSEHWSAEHLAECLADERADPNSFGYDDWAIAPLERVMEDAGNAYIAAHRDLFRGDLI